MPASSPVDLIDTLREQHDEIRALLGATEAAAGPDRAGSLAELRDLLAVHHRGECLLPGADPAERARLDAALAGLDPADPGFGPALARFAADLRAHVERAERVRFPAVRASVSPDHLHDLGNQLLKAERGVRDA